MPISDLTSPDAVEAALAEFDQLGRDAFLKQYGFGRARRYFVSRGGNHYDSKAIVGAAVGFEHPDRGPLLHTEPPPHHQPRARTGPNGELCVSGHGRPSVHGCAVRSADTTFAAVFSSVTKAM